MGLPEYRQAFSFRRFFLKPVFSRLHLCLRQAIFKEILNRHIQLGHFLFIQGAKTLAGGFQPGQGLQCALVFWHPASGSQQGVHFPKAQVGKVATQDKTTLLIGRNNIVGQERLTNALPLVSRQT